MERPEKTPDGREESLLSLRVRKQKCNKDEEMIYLSQNFEVDKV